MITDELREYANKAIHREDYMAGMTFDLNRIADRIDEECARRQEDLIDETLGGLIKMTDENMEKRGWIRLPKDADGEYIHIGDVMDSDHREDGTVEGIQYFKNMQNMRMLIAVRPHNWDTPTWYDPEEYRHHHEPTVEDVLREFTDAILKWAGKSGTVAETGTWSDVASEYVERLQLREA